MGSTESVTATGTERQQRLKESGRLGKEQGQRPWEAENTLAHGNGNGNGNDVVYGVLRMMKEAAAFAGECNQMFVMVAIALDPNEGLSHPPQPPRLTARLEHNS